MHHITILPLALFVVLAFSGCASEIHRASPEKAPPQPAKEEAHSSTHTSSHSSGPVVTAVEAIARLSAGNARFVYGRRSESVRTPTDQDVRSSQANGQHPFAAILTCADSRLPPELIFDQGLGQLFVVRNAGNVAEPVGEGSLEYGVEHLNLRLVVVLGHHACGAVTAVTASPEPLPGNLVAIQKEMSGLQAAAAKDAAAGKAKEQVLAAAVERNAIAQAQALLKESETLRKATKNGLVVVPAIYDLDGGGVRFLPPVP